MYLNGKPCDEWTGAIEKTGYGRRKVGGKMWLAHRYAYFLAHGDIDPGLVIDHLCHNRACVEAAHLAQATRANNSARHKPDCTCSTCTGVGRKWETCARGHDLNAPGVRSSRASNGCKRCRTEWMRSYRARQKAMRAAA